MGAEIESISSDLGCRCRSQCRGLDLTCYRPPVFPTESLTVNNQPCGEIWVRMGIPLRLETRAPFNLPGRRFGVRRHSGFDTSPGRTSGSNLPFVAISLLVLPVTGCSGSLLCEESLKA